jgi:hypothetical protein
VATTAASSSLASQTSSTTSTPTESSDPAVSSVSGGTIAGAVVGSVAGFALIILAVFFLFRWRRSQRTADHEHTSEMGGANQDNGSYGDNAYQTTNAYNNGDKALPSVPDGASSHDPASLYNHAPPTYQNYAELPVNQAHEMESPQGPHSQLRELDTGYQGSELQNDSQNHGQNYSHGQQH